MKKLLLIIGCEELGLNQGESADGTAVTDTLYISNDTTIYIGADTLNY